MKLTRLLASVVHSILALLAFSFALVARAETTLDLLVVYTPGVASSVEDAYVYANQQVTIANRAFNDSGLDITVRIVDIKPLELTSPIANDQLLLAATKGDEAPFTEIENWRAAAGADQVVVMTPYTNVSGSCGVAYVLGYKSGLDGMRYSNRYAYSVVNSGSCSGLTLAHELGHNLGLVHSRRQNPEGGVFPHAAGYGVDGQFVTLMAYPSQFGVSYSGRLGIYSSPLLTACKGQPCGVSVSDPVNGADDVAALQLTAPVVEAFLPSPAVLPIQQLLNGESLDDLIARKTQLETEYIALSNRIVAREAQKNSLNQILVLTYTKLAQVSKTIKTLNTSLAKMKKNDKAKIAQLQRRFDATKLVYDSTKKQITQLKNKLADITVWRTQLDTLMAELQLISSRITALQA